MPFFRTNIPLVAFMGLNTTPKWAKNGIKVIIKTLKTISAILKTTFSTFKVPVFGGDISEKKWAKSAPVLPKSVSICQKPKVIGRKSRKRGGSSAPRNTKIGTFLPIFHEQKRTDFYLKI